MPALTFMHSTSHTSQNCGIPQTFFTCTWRWVIMVLELGAGGVQPAGFQPVPDILARPYSMPAPALYAALQDVALRQERVFPLAAYPERGQAFWVARSAVFNFPDVISAEIRANTPETSTIVLYSRSIYGSSDLGVNRKRLVAWIAALDAVSQQRRP